MGIQTLKDVFAPPKFKRIRYKREIKQYENIFLFLTLTLKNSTLSEILLEFGLAPKRVGVKLELVFGQNREN